MDYTGLISWVCFVVSFVVTFFAFPVMIPRFKRAKIVGKDMHKPGQPEIAEMGGLVITAGFSAGVITAIAIKMFSPVSISIDLISILAAFCMILIIALLGITDDLIGVRQSIKALTPLLASFPLVAIKAGQTTMTIPFIGQVDFGIAYSFVLIPLGVTGASNAFNMLAGFNGLEVGMGIVAVGTLAVIAHSIGATTSFVLLTVTLGGLLAALRYNWYPAKVFIGDVGTYSLGAIIVSAVILGNFETAGVIIIIPYALDFLIKVKNRLPSKQWWGIYRDGKLFCPESGPLSLGHLIMKLCGGITERKLVLALIALEAIFGAIAILLYA